MVKASGIGDEESKISKILDESLHKYELMMRNDGSVVFLPSINYASISRTYVLYVY